MLVPEQYHFTGLEHNMLHLENCLTTGGTSVREFQWKTNLPFFFGCGAFGRRFAMMLWFKSLRHDLDISTWCVDTCQMICLVFAFVQPKLFLWKHILCVWPSTKRFWLCWNSGAWYHCLVSLAFSAHGAFASGAALIVYGLLCLHGNQIQTSSEHIVSLFPVSRRYSNCFK
jgi:hypothetical protein